MSLVLITGGAGFLGQHLVAALRERGDTVRVLDRPSQASERLADQGVEFYPGDVCQADSVAEPMRGVDAVIHLAAMQAVWRPMADFHAVNVTGTANVCEAALSAGVRRLIHISSWTVYGMGTREPAREDSPVAPLNEPYSVTKLLGERHVRRLIEDNGLPATIVRPDTIFGPGDHVHIGRMADRLRAGRSIIVGSGRNAMPFVYVTDVVQLLLLALDEPAAVGQTYNVASDQLLTQEELLTAIAQDVGTDPPRRHVPYSLLYAVGSVAESVAKVSRSRRKPILTRLGVGIFGADNRHSIEKAQRELGYAPAVPVRDGIRIAADWYRREYLRHEPDGPRVSPVPAQDR